MFNAFDYPDDSVIEQCRENELKDGRDIKRSIRVLQGTHGTHVCAVAVARDENVYMENRILTIPVSGDPLSRECYDTIRDVFVVEGVDWIEVGNIPVNYILHAGDSNFSWNIDVPVPQSVINRYLSKEQKANLNQWKSRWNRSDYRIEFLQSLLVY
jgi:hypothetical protein